MDNPTAPAFVRYWSNRGHRGDLSPYPLLTEADISLAAIPIPAAAQLRRAARRNAGFRRD